MGKRSRANPRGSHADRAVPHRGPATVRLRQCCRQVAKPSSSSQRNLRAQPQSSGPSEPAHARVPAVSTAPRSMGDLLTRTGVRSSTGAGSTDRLPTAGGHEDATRGRPRTVAPGPWRVTTRHHGPLPPGPARSGRPRSRRARVAPRPGSGSSTPRSGILAPLGLVASGRPRTPRRALTGPMRGPTGGLCESSYHLASSTGGDVDHRRGMQPRGDAVPDGPAGHPVAFGDAVRVAVGRAVGHPGVVRCQWADRQLV